MINRARKLNAMRRYNGTWPTARWLIDQCAQRTRLLHLLRVVWLDGGSGELPPIPRCEGIDFRFIEADEMQTIVRDPSYDLEETMVARVANDLNLCFGAFHHDRLASYCWFARECIEPEHNFHIACSFARDTAYNYKAFTHVDFRGMKLRGAVVLRAIQPLAERGIRKLVGIVESTNLASYKSCLQCGFVDIGSVYRLCGWDIVPSSLGKHGICFGGSADLSARQQPRAVDSTRVPHLAAQAGLHVER